MIISHFVSKSKRISEFPSIGFFASGHLYIFGARKLARRFFLNLKNIRRAEYREKIFRQTKQNSTRVVAPTRRDFVKYHGKASAEFSCDDFFKVPFIPASLVSRFFFKLLKTRDNPLHFRKITIFFVENSEISPKNSFE